MALYMAMKQMAEIQSRQSWNRCWAILQEAGISTGRNSG